MTRSFRTFVLQRLLPLLLLCMQPAAWADEPGAHTVFACRDDDPFVVCTQGCKGKDYNWTPLSPTSGTWIAVAGYCPWPQSKGACCVGNVCFQLWTNTAVRAVAQYMAVCPRAHEEGNWEGSGRPESTPYDH
jgi:hypothetical protein